jgi:hypothetical protein
MAAAPVSREEIKTYLDNASSEEDYRYTDELIDKAGDNDFRTKMRPILEVLQIFKSPVIVDYSEDSIVMQFWLDVVDGFENATGLVVRPPNKQNW